MYYTDIDFIGFCTVLCKTWTMTKKLFEEAWDAARNLLKIIMELSEMIRSYLLSLAKSIRANLAIIPTVICSWHNLSNNER